MARQAGQSRLASGGCNNGGSAWCCLGLGKAAAGGECAGIVGEEGKLRAAVGDVRQEGERRSSVVITVTLRVMCRRQWPRG